MRTLSLTMRNAMLGQESGEVAVVLLTITHPDLAEPILLSSDATTRISDDPLQYATASRGKSYLHFPFAIVLPDDIGERAPVAQLQIENVSRELVTLIRSVTSGPSVTMELVLASSPDHVEIVWPNFQMKGAVYNANVITLQLGINAMSDIRYPEGSFDPASFPGLF